MLRNSIGGGEHEAHVRIFRLAQRGRHEYIDGVEFSNDRVIGSGPQLAAIHKRLEDFIRNIFYVRMAAIELVDLGLLDVDPDHFEARVRELDSQRETNV